VTRPLFLAYYFPPTGGAGAQRPARFVRCLHELGSSPAVVAAPGGSLDRWSPQDESLLAEIPTGIQIRRARGEPPVASPWRDRGARWLWLRSPWAEWWVREAVAAGLEVEDVDAVYAIMPPYVTAEAAATLARRLGKPWVADLGDPWALDEMAVYPTALHRRLETARMRRLLGTAAAVVMTTPEAVRRIQSAFPELADRLVVSIPMGYDGRDFADPAGPRADGAFRIVHTGAFHADLGREQRHFVRHLLGGGFKGVDILTRSHVYLLEALQRLLARDPALASRIELHLAGVLSESDTELARRSPLVRLRGYLPHPETIDLMRSADLLFLPMQNLPRGQRSATVPGKTYEYLASRRPILAAVPEGDGRDILLRAGTAHVCAPDDSGAMEGIIRAELDGNGHLSGADAGVIESFEYGPLSRRVAQLLDSVASAVRRS
jgi:hypothetical protein